MPRYSKLFNLFIYYKLTIVITQCRQLQLPIAHGFDVNQPTCGSKPMTTSRKYVDGAKILIRTAVFLSLST